MTSTTALGCVHALFEQQTERTPDAVALECGALRLTYRELDTAAASVAAGLAAAGVGEGAFVGITTVRSEELVIGLLGILKVGAAYVPLDPNYPEERLALLARQAGVRIALEVRVPGVDTLRIGELRGTRDRLGELTTSASPRSAAYVMFTSGSTGVPKGVCIEHRSIVRLVRGVDTFAADDVFLAAAPLAFDASTFEIWAPLLTGRRLVLAPNDFSIDQLATLVRTHGVTVLWLTSGLFNQVVDQALGVLAGVRQLFCGGDVLSPVHVRRVLAEHPTLRLVNGYGPTENTTFTTTHHIVAAPDGERIPIGRPLLDTTVYVLDPNGAQLPVGSAGELYTGGAGVARGYLAGAAATAERFLPDPFAAEPGGRMYRTGDLAQWRPDGAVDFLGRIDSQVKIRGFRIELGEIESALSAFAAVREVVVVARPDRSGDKVLVAHVVLADRVEPRQLREFLERRLPAHLIPAAYVVHEALPLGPTGKVDRKALPAPTDDAFVHADYVAPRTATERAIAEIWSGLLGGRKVGLHDNFLALGGNSLLAMRAASSLRAMLSIELPAQRSRAWFDGTTVAALASELERCADDQVAPPLTPVPRDGSLALSFTQQRLWFMAKLEPNSRVYNLPSAHRLRGPLDPQALRRTFEALVDRHEALRTVFPATEGVPRQHILPPNRFTLVLDDLTTLAPEGREREARRRAEQAALVAFDLEVGPLLVARVLALSADDHVLLITVHHIVADGWSMAVMWRELGALYEAFARGAVPSLPELRVQYADYAAWQRGWLTGETLESQLAYWKQQLEGAEGDLALPYKDARRAGTTIRGGRVELVLDPTLTVKLHDVARHHGGTLFMVVTAALRALLARYCGQRDLCIGTATANRGHRDVEGLIGFFVNTLVLRGEVRRDDRFSDLLARERETALAAYEHQDAPFDLVVSALGLERSASRTPLIQVICIDHGVIDEPVLPGLATQPFPIELELEPFELAVETHERAGARDIVISYDENLFARATVSELLARYHRLLLGIVERPTVLLSQIELLSPDERATLLVEPARHVAWESNEPSVVAQIERWMRETPETPAIWWNAATTSYRELEVITGRLAGLLGERGVGPDRVVIVCAHRGPLQIIGLVAALRAGAAYLPIDPDLPAERISWMLEDAAPAAILCDGPPPAAFDNYAALVVQLDEPLATYPALSSTVLPDSLAYIIYTSGSTGRPKGVMVTRRNFDAQMNWLQREFPLAAGERVLQLLSFTFDGSVWDIFWPLMAGGTLVLPRPGGELDPQYLGELVAATQTAVVHVVPSMMSLLVEAIDGAVWESVKWILTGGEALSVDLARRTTEAFPQAELVNVYGPTEVTVTATFCRYRDDGKPISIGGPVADTTVYVLDDDFAPVPPGGIGELWLGGIQVVRGYLQRPMLTAERFVPNPFAARAGERIYRTGDLVRQRTDGILEYVGRADFQVKVRGFRIELGEIEAALCDHPDVRVAAVVTRGEAATGKSLVAYVCLSAGWAEVDDLRDFVAARLPDYMIPSAFVILEDLPLTTSGKLDRRALPDPDVSQSEHEPPEGETEQALAQLWVDLLQVEQVGRNDNFFTLGGHSLLAIRLLESIRTGLHANLKLHDLFEAPTLAEMATKLVPGEAASRVAVKRLSQTEGPTGILQAYYYGVFEGDPQLRAPLVIPIVRRLQGPLVVSAVERAVIAVTMRHEILRTRYVKQGTELRQIVGTASPSFECVELDHEGLAGAIAAFVKPIDLGHGPMLRIKLIRLAPQDHALLIGVHHIYFDAAFEALFYQDLAAAYLEQTQPALPLQFLDVATYLAAYRDTPAGRADLAYWANQLQGVQPLELPIDFPRDEIEAERVAQYAVTGQHYVVHAPVAIVALEGDEALARAVANAVRDTNTTPLVYFIAAVVQMLHRATGQTDIVLLTALNVRPLLDAEQVIGGFNNPVAVRIDFSPPVTREQILLQVRDRFSEAYSHALISPFQNIPASAGRVNVGFAGGSEPAALRLGDAIGTAVPVPGSPVLPFDLRPAAMFADHRITVSLNYLTSLFRRETIERLCHDCLEVLRLMADDPHGDVTS